MDHTVSHAATSEAYPAIDGETRRVVYSVVSDSYGEL
jgi:hypothetical protein